MHLIWTLEGGLHEASSNELRDEATDLVIQAHRPWNRRRRNELLQQAARLFDEADESGEAEADDELREEVARHIATEKDPYRKTRMIEQAHRRWGDRESGEGI